MKFFKFGDYIRSWSVWVMGAITVTPILDDRVEFIANLVPAEYKPYVVSGLGIVALIARAIVQKK